MKKAVAAAARCWAAAAERGGAVLAADRPPRVPGAPCPPSWMSPLSLAGGIFGIVNYYANLLRVRAVLCCALLLWRPCSGASANPVPPCAALHCSVLRCAVTCPRFVLLCDGCTRISSASGRRACPPTTHNPLGRAQVDAQLELFPVALGCLWALLHRSPEQQPKHALPRSGMLRLLAQHKLAERVVSV